jgi:formylglycine-generating enzyme required for sulfatase activity
MARYDVNEMTDPVGPASGSYRVFRGGSWENGEDYCRVVYRSIYCDPASFYGYFGFRVVRSLVL